MFIRALTLRSLTEGKIMRQIKFHKGVNFVIDSEASERHNKVGKTTFLKLIDILMGAKDRTLIYRDAETNSETTQLKNIIEGKQVVAELAIASNLNGSSQRDVNLKVELFRGGKYYIDGVRMSQKDYHKELNRLFFRIEDGSLTFRQLIKCFVRVSVDGDDNSFLKTLPPTTKNATYRSIYNFLFGISDPALDAKLGEAQAEFRRTETALLSYKKIKGVRDIEQQKQILIALEESYSHLKTQVNDIFDPDEYQKNREEIASVRAKYAELTDRLSHVSYKVESNKRALEDAEAEKSRKADLDISRKFYDEVCSMLPEINKTFEEMVLFNIKLCDNKIAYFKELGATLLEEEGSVKKQIDELLSNYSRYLSLVERDCIDEYEQLTEKLAYEKQKIAEHNEIIKTLQEFEDELASIQHVVDMYSTDGEERAKQVCDYQSAMNSFNKVFTYLSERINGEHPVLIYEPDTNRFPVSITEISGSSTGTRKSLIAAYDLAYQQFALTNEISTPRFVVHDVVENVEGNDINAIVSAANAIDSQYIVAVLQEKLVSSQISSEMQQQLTILELAEDDKLFEGRSVDENMGVMSF